MSRSPRRGRAGIARRVVPALVIGIAVYYAVWGGEYSVFDLRTLTVRQQAAAVELAELQQEVDSLSALHDRLENDPATIEAVARERFGMIRDGELLYRFVEVDTVTAP